MIDPKFARQIAESDQDFANTVEQLRWAFSASDSAGQALGRSIAQATTLISRQCDHAQFLLAFLTYGCMRALEEINREAGE